MSVREYHQVRIKRDQQQNVECKCEHKRYDDRTAADLNAPVRRYNLRRGQDYSDEEDGRNDEGDSESLADLRHHFEEVGPLDLLLRRPCHVVRKQMDEDRLAEVDTEPAEEEREKGEPLDVIPECFAKISLAQSIFDRDESDVAERSENNDGSKHALETVHIEMVERELEAD